MRIKPIKEVTLFKKKFEYRFIKIINLYPSFDELIHHVLKISDAYVIGGFLRDIQIGKNSRDLDLIIDLPEIELDRIVTKLDQSLFKKNRMGGYKLQFDGFDIDFWSIDNNWAFKNNLVKQSDKYYLDGIAKGCFYNFDALVINIKTLELNVKFFNECLVKNELDILMRRPVYQKLNPTREANILRAFYLKKTFGLNFSNTLLNYLNSQIDYIEFKGIDPVKHLLKTLSKYKKYQNLFSEKDIENFVDEIKNDEIQNFSQITKQFPRQLEIKLDKTKVRHQIINLEPNIPMEFFGTGGIDYYNSKFFFKYAAQKQPIRIQLALKDANGQTVSRTLLLDQNGLTHFQFTSEIESLGLNRNFGFVELISQSSFKCEFWVEET